MLHVTLKVVGGEVDSAETPLALPAIIGRGHDVTVNLTHPLVSRRHCELCEVDGQLRVRDLGSLNGTFIGSERVVEAILRPGELLTVGTVTFRAVYESTVVSQVPGGGQGHARKVCDTAHSIDETLRVDGAAVRPAAPHTPTQIEARQ
jgi:hypothetical protein